MNKWLIYSKNNCPYCDKAKFALQGEDVEVKNINDKPGYLQELLEKILMQELCLKFIKMMN